MGLDIGDRLGPYEVTGPLGAGGMGEVYRARDTRLGRTVAIKILPTALAADAERLARFEREARTLAALNHPNIAVLYGIEDGGATTALVLELVEGQTLADRVAAGPIPVDEALAIARQIADALEAAHEQGIVHRDVKPGNIKLKPDGAVKVLDFGIAKVVDPAAAGDPSLPTATAPAMTHTGVILGTAAYMSPEQARGRPIDKRTDIWAFGCVLFEMLTGRRAFDAGDTSATLANVITSEPDWTLLPPLAPAVRRVLRQCLAKDPRQRLRDIGDARLALSDSSEAAASPAGPAAAQAPASAGAWRWAVATAVIASIVTAAVISWFGTSEVPEVVRFQLHAPPGSTIPLGTPAVSPDGRTIAYSVDDASGVRRLHVRGGDGLESRALPQTEGATHPLWSSDGRSVAFVSGGQLKRIDVAGGPARDVVAATDWQVAWNQAGEFLFIAPGPLAGLAAVAEHGSPKTGLVPLDSSKGEQNFRFPAFLPDGRRFLGLVAFNDGRYAIQLASLDSPERRPVLDDVDSAPILASTPRGAYLLSMVETELVAHEFDVNAGTVRGAPRLVVGDVGRVAFPAFMPSVGVSPAGVLAYQTGGEYQDVVLSWYARSGTHLGDLPLDASGPLPNLSPDGQRLAVTGPRTTNFDIWVTDLRRGAAARFTFANSRESNPVWSPDGQRIAFTSGATISVKNADGGDVTVLHRVPGGVGFLLDWSPDGRSILYGSPRGMYLAPVDGTDPLLRVGSTEGQSGLGKISPDGRHIVFVSNESGRREVYVQERPPSTRVWKVSVAGGEQPRWNPNGRELFFVSGRGMEVVDVVPGPAFSAGTPRLLFPLPASSIPTLNGNGWDVAPDGQRFLLAQRRSDRVDNPITVVLNWWTALERRP